MPKELQETLPNGQCEKWDLILFELKVRALLELEVDDIYNFYLSEHSLAESAIML